MQQAYFIIPYYGRNKAKPPIKGGLGLGIY